MWLAHSICTTLLIFISLGHRDLLVKAKILHRDISLNNLMLLAKKLADALRSGLLIDYDYAADEDEERAAGRKPPLNPKNIPLRRSARVNIQASDCGHRTVSYELALLVPYLLKLFREHRLLCHTIYCLTETRNTRQLMIWSPSSMFFSGYVLCLKGLAESLGAGEYLIL